MKRTVTTLLLFTVVGLSAVSLPVTAEELPLVVDGREVPAEVATEGLVVHYRADNADGAGNPGAGKFAVWADLAIEYGEANWNERHQK